MKTNEWRTRYDYLNITFHPNQNREDKPVLDLVETTQEPNPSQSPSPSDKPTFLQGIIHTLHKFKNKSLFIPFLLNQTSGICYYQLIATTTLTNPAYCNALSMIFSAVMGHYLGERLDTPIFALIGSMLVVAGVMFCIMSEEL